MLLRHSGKERQERTGRRGLISTLWGKESHSENVNEWFWQKRYSACTTYYSSPVLYSITEHHFLGSLCSLSKVYKQGFGRTSADCRGKGGQMWSWRPATGHQLQPKEVLVKRWETRAKPSLSGENMRFLHYENAKHTKLPQFVQTDGWVSFSWVIIGQASLIIRNKIKNWVKFREPDIWVCCVVVACHTVGGAQSSVQLYRPAIRTGGGS